uniref:Uncharacterized protein n=1 Tax=Ditylenchus dipsaci TaxID=166011 RepID=A0A915EMC8_9BILA
MTAQSALRGNLAASSNRSVSGKKGSSTYEIESTLYGERLQRRINFALSLHTAANKSEERIPGVRSSIRKYPMLEQSTYGKYLVILKVRMCVASIKNVNQLMLSIRLRSGIAMIFAEEESQDRPMLTKDGIFDSNAFPEGPITALAKFELFVEVEDSVDAEEILCEGIKSGSIGRKSNDKCHLFQRN